MIGFVHAAPVSLEAYRMPNLGVFSSPRRFYLDVDGWQWAADNDAFSAWDEDRYVAMIDALENVPGCTFVTTPDVVGDSDETTRRYWFWIHALEKRGLPAAYVTQDGCRKSQVPWNTIAALFIGGSDEWKMGEANRALVNEAKLRGLWVHMGRVNGHQRIRYAKAIGCDSFDGTSMSWFKDRWLRQYLVHAGDGQPQGLLT